MCWYGFDRERGLWFYSPESPCRNGLMQFFLKKSLTIFVSWKLITVEIWEIAWNYC
jgi:hypothetical protein